jgi:hypothetical protein
MYIMGTSKQKVKHCSFYIIVKAVQKCEENQRLYWRDVLWNLGRDFPIKAFVAISISLEQNSLWIGSVITESHTVERVQFFFRFLF